MIRLIPACSFAAACVFAVSVSAQDTTVKTKTRVEADDAKVITMTGCLSKAPAGDLFVLAGAMPLKGDDMKSKSKTKIDVDDDETEVKTRSKTEVETDDDEAVGTSGSVATYELMPKEGVDLSKHVGHKVEVTAVALKGVVKYPIRIKCALLAWEALDEALTLADEKSKGTSNG